MSDLKLGADGDLDLSSGGLELVTGTDAIVHHTRIVMRFFKGEWYLDTRVGIPYLQSILGARAPKINVIRSIFRKAILAVNGVLAVRGLVVDFTSATRTLAVAFEAQVQGEDAPISFDERLVL